MPIPGAERAIIPPEKLRDYVLSPTRLTQQGDWRQLFFGRLGYSSVNWQQLEEDLRAKHLCLDAASSELTALGVKYRIVGPMARPGRRKAEVMSVWIVLTGESVPRLVTLFPHR
jgi:hypothetical protein